MGNVHQPPSPVFRFEYHTLTYLLSDPLPARPHPHHRAAKNTPLLRAPTETKRDGRFHRGYNTDSSALAAGRVLYRALRDFYLVWRFFCDDWRVCGERAGGGAMGGEGDGGSGSGEEEQRVACLSR